MVRVGSLVNESLTEPDETENKTQLTAAKQLDGIAEVTRRLYEARSVCYNALRKELSAGGVKILRASDLTPRQTEECRAIFMRHVLPLLSLMVLDAKHPLMQFENKRGYVICQLEKDGRRMIGVVSLNPSLDRLYRLSGEKEGAPDPRRGARAAVRQSRLYGVHGERSDAAARHAQRRFRYGD